jgi:hypothetical protein
MKLGSRKSTSGGVSFLGLLVFAPVLLVATGMLCGGDRIESRRVFDKNASLSDSGQQSKDGRISFQLLSSGRAAKKGALNVSFNTYQSPDNIRVYYSIESYDSEESARAELENMVKHASKIIERGQKNSPDGRVIGERAVLISACTLTAKNNQTVVVWTDKAALAVLCSQSKGHALDFEQQVHSPRPL